MITSVAVCPCAPLLVPELAGESDDLSDVRHECELAVRWMVDHALDQVIVLAAPESDDVPCWGSEAGGTFACFGLDIRAGGADRSLPAGLTIGAWLLDRVGWRGPRAYVSGPVQDRGRTGLLVLADGSARHSNTAPGYFDSRASAFDASIEDGLRGGNTGILAAIDPDLAAQLWSNAAMPLHELARIGEKHHIDPALFYAGAPFGVGYWVATWKLTSKPGI